jgi:anti-sigma B factor antagonist
MISRIVMLQLDVVHECARFVVVKAAGEIDIAAAPGLAEKLDDVFDAQRPDVVVDLSEVTFLDSSGLAVLVAHFKSVLAAGGEMRLVVTEPRVRQVLEITGLDRVFPIYDSADSALTKKT